MEDWKPKYGWLLNKWVSSALVHWDVWIVFKKHLYCFLSEIGSLWMLRANCMHWSMALYIGNFSLFGFWYLQGVMDPISCRCRGTAGVVSLHGFFNCVGISFINPCVVQGSAVVSLKLLLLLNILWNSSKRYYFGVVIRNLILGASKF